MAANETGLSLQDLHLTAIRQFRDHGFTQLRLIWRVSDNDAKNDCDFGDGSDGIGIHVR